MMARNTYRDAAVFAMVFIVALVWNAPSRFLFSFFGLSSLPMSHTQMFGTVWQGGATGVRVGSFAIGQVSYDVTPIHFDLGTPLLEWQSTSPHVQGRGKVGLSPSRYQVHDSDFSLKLGGLYLDIPFDGTFTANVSFADFYEGTCEAADGTAELTGRSASIEGFDAVLNGGVSCEGSTLQISLAGTVGPYPAELVVVYGGGSHLRMNIRLNDVRSDHDVMLSALGFQRSGQGYELVQTTQLR